MPWASLRLQRACAYAEGNRSNMNCTACAEWWHPANVYGATEEAAARQLLRHRPHWRSGAQRPTLAWFTCATKPEVNGSDAWRLEYLQHIRVAVASALLNARSLAPHVIYLHSTHQPYVDDEFTSFLRAVGAFLFSKMRGPGKSSGTGFPPREPSVGSQTPDLALPGVRFWQLLSHDWRQPPGRLRPSRALSTPPLSQSGGLDGPKFSLSQPYALSTRHLPNRYIKYKIKKYQNNQ